MKTKVLLSIILALTIGSCQKKTKLSGDVLIENVNVVNVKDGIIIPDQNILIDGNRIADIRTRDEKIRYQAEIHIKATNKYLIPGLWDMHTHPDDPEVWRMNPKEEEKDRLLPLFVINGVTGIRDMGGDIGLVKRWREKYKKGELLAPKIFAGGPLLDGPNPMWDGSVGIGGPDEVKKVVDSLINEGIDFLKVYSLLPPDTYMALSKYAKEINFPFVGHVPFSVPPSAAAKTGMKSQEHLLEILKECSDRPSDKFLDDLRKIDDRIERSNRINGHRLATFRETKADSLYDIFREYQTWHCPTLSMWHKNAWYESEYPGDKELVSLLPPYLKAYWTPEQNDHLKYRDNQEFIKTKQRLYKLYLQMVGRMHQKGVKLLAGTDMGANPLCHPGVGLHNELDAFVNAGLTPTEALKTATINPALFLEIEDEYGTVEVNKVSDLVVLDSNPLEDIENVKKISFVIREGKVITKKEIAKIKDEIMQSNTKR